MPRCGPLLLSLLALLSCSSPTGSEPGPLEPPPEEEGPIVYQTRTTYAFQDSTVFFSNEFPGARLSDMTTLGQGRYRAVIRPENAPINPSPWYSFKAWAEASQAIQITLSYVDGNHRYDPKLSTDGSTWTRIAPQSYVVNSALGEATLAVQIGPDTLWVSAQELIAVSHMQEWMESLASRDFVVLDTIGLSLDGRELVAVEIGSAANARRHILVVGRQHPPEVTGAIALKAFMERLAEGDSLASRFREVYAVSAVPVANPDGVDEGHWRHNANGFDLNRDWVDFNEPETAAIRDYFLAQAGEGGDQVYVGIDFHSTYSDRFYPLSDSFATNPPNLMEDWLAAIQARFPEEELDIRPSGTSLGTTRAFFYPAFGCPAVIYEVGDDTPREHVRTKARVAAEALMELVLEL